MSSIIDNQSITAQILIGPSTKSSKGVTPTHTLFLLENADCNWVLSPITIFRGKSFYQENIIWTPTTKYLLQDAILMLAVNVLKESNIVSLAKQYFRKSPFQNRILDNDIHIEDLTQLHKQCKYLALDYKLVLTVMKKSSVRQYLDSLKDYNMNIEICHSN